MKLNQNRNKTVSFQPKQSTKTAVKTFSCQSHSVSAVCAPSHKQRIPTVIG